jgi:hypothetical protein
LSQLPAPILVNECFQFVQQGLGAAYAECRDENDTTVCQRLFNELFELLSPGFPTDMLAISIGAFQHNDICAPWGLGGAKVSGEDNFLPLTEMASLYFDIG